MADEKELRYDPATIEPKWQKRWAADPKFYAAEPATSGKPKYYVLEMLPYPSGQLHMGHVRNYSIGDALARHMWMRGYNVLHPMGWDAFGLPAENAALKNNTPPREWTLSNIAAMKRQMQRLGLGYDWATEVTTCLPDYYRWNQWFFLRMYETGPGLPQEEQGELVPGVRHGAGQRAGGGRLLLATRRHQSGAARPGAVVPAHHRLCRGVARRPGQTGRLAGKSVHHAAQLDRPQRRHGGRLLPGRKQGSEIRRDREQGSGIRKDADSRLYHARGYDLRRDQRAAGAAACAGGGVHGRRSELKAQVDELLEQQKKAREAGDLGAIEKHGVPTGRFAVNPYNGQRVPIWVANYILADYGTGAIMSVPAHDERDFEFATKYGLPIVEVIRPAGQDSPAELPFVSEDGVLVNSGEYNGLSCEAAQKKLQEVAALGAFGEAKVTFRLKDWGVSRQRYWGTPIPMIHCERDGIVPVPDEQLPVLLPEQIEITQQGGSPLARVPEFVNVTCPQCGGRPSARPTPWTPSSIRAGTSIAIRMRRTRRRPLIRRSRNTGSPSTNTSAAWSMQFCTSSTRASGPG